MKSHKYFEFFWKWIGGENIVGEVFDFEGVL